MYFVSGRICAEECDSAGLESWCQLTVTILIVSLPSIQPSYLIMTRSTQLQNAVAARLSRSMTAINRLKTFRSQLHVHPKAEELVHGAVRSAAQEMQKLQR